MRAADASHYTITDFILVRVMVGYMYLSRQTARCDGTEVVCTIHRRGELNQNRSTKNTVHAVGRVRTTARSVPDSSRKSVLVVSIEHGISSRGACNESGLCTCDAGAEVSAI